MHGRRDSIATRAHRGAQLIVALALLAGVIAIAPAAARKRTHATVETTQAGIERALDERQVQIQECVMNHAMNRGATSVSVGAHLLINNHGQVFDCKVSVEADRGSTDTLAACAEQVLRTAAFPPSSSPMVVIERSWRFATQ